jgi:hypothetical protein
MKNIKKIAIATFCFAGFLGSTACELTQFTPEDCTVDVNYNIQCDPFEPGVTAKS